MPASTPVVRFAAESDGEAILALVGRLGHAVPVDAQAFGSSFLHVLADHPRSLLHVAEVDGVIAGYALTTITQLLYTNGPSAQLQEASDLLKNMNGPETSGKQAQEETTWKCDQCGELLESQFTDCWNCGAPREEVLS